MTFYDLTMTSLWPHYDLLRWFQNQIDLNLNLERSFCNLMAGLARILEKLFDKGFYDVIITI